MEFHRYEQKQNFSIDKLSRPESFFTSATIFLKRMFEACKINFSDIALMNISQNPEADYNKLYKFFESRVIILFDIEPSSLGIPLSFPQFQVQPFGNCLFLFTPSIEKLEEDSLQRSKLWICLKRIFNI